MEPEKILEALRTHYKESIFVTDGEGKVIFANAVAEERLGVPHGYLEGRYVDDLVKAGVYKHSTTADVIRTKQPVVARISSKGEDYTFSNSVPVLDEKGELKMIVTNNMSIKHNKEWESIIVQERAEADRLRRELDFLRLHDKKGIVAVSQAMKNILSTIDAIAPTDSNVVIMGESGTGKDMMARLICEKSQRADNAFISVNCAAIPEALLESELFGYESGAFTGALSKGKIGLFEAASGGTLFLDEIGDMPLVLQSKLLRTLESQEVRRVGGVRNIPVNVRVICATNRDLRDMVSKKLFREDLYYRLAVFVIKLPRLCERPDDILPIANMFLKELNEKHSTNKRLSEITKQTMMQYAWPGNIRELRNVVERIFVISNGDELVFTPVPTAGYGKNFSEMANPLLAEGYGGLHDFIEHVEYQYVKKVLKDCDGSVVRAAKKLDIHRSSLYRILNKENK